MPENNENKIAPNQSPNDVYQKAHSDPQAMMDAILSFGTDVLHINAETWKKFVNDNLKTLMLECDRYGLVEDNPFLIFLKTYADREGSLDVFCGDEGKTKYNLLHNAVAQGKLDAKDVAFKSKEIDNSNIILNPNLWARAVRDIKWILEVNDWLNTADLNAYVKNAYILNLFAKNTSDLSSGINGEDMPEVNLNTKANRNCLRKALFFSDIISRATEAGRKEADSGFSMVDNLRKDLDAVNKLSLISTPLLPPTSIEQQANLLNQDVNENKRNPETGQYQDKDTLQNDNEQADQRRENNPQAMTIDRQTRNAVNDSLRVAGITNEQLEKLRKAVGSARAWERLTQALNQMYK